jgi:hypothetical protein
MPYIESKTDRRQKLRNGEPALIAGELNYQIFYYIKHNTFVDKNRIIDFVEQFLGDKPNYQRYNDMTGALVRCSREIIRRLSKDGSVLIDIMNSYDEEIDKYENKKILENGDVE